MEWVHDKAAMQARALDWRAQGKRIGFVPTMGALHAGHVSLVAIARPGCDVVAVSVFVNPMQFGPGEDFERYPRDLDGDARALAAAGCDLVFAPATTDMYAGDARAIVEVQGLQDTLCGRSRPGHFRGVATVVAKLLHLVQPAVAVFGQKDAQQAVILRRMVRDLDFPVAMRIAPIVRHPDGLAMSSRNAYLSPEERREALLLHESLAAARAVVQGGGRDAGRVTAAARAVLQRGTRLRVDYVECVDPEDLLPRTTLWGRTLIAVAAFVGKTRLIDNVVLDIRETGVQDVAL